MTIKPLFQRSRTLHQAFLLYAVEPTGDDIIRPSHSQALLG
ncbi:MAG: hypothetical protein U9Q66_03490 [Patescibacteria group bacterium]|nr:hypothetical protein [Patescibacteria group bacterium]